MILLLPHEKNKGKYVSNNSYTGIFIKPRPVTKLRTLGQLRHRSGASPCSNLCRIRQTIPFSQTLTLHENWP